MCVCEGCGHAPTSATGRRRCSSCLAPALAARKFERWTLHRVIDDGNKNDSDSVDNQNECAARGLNMIMNSNNLFLVRCCGCLFLLFQLVNLVGGGGESATQLAYELQQN